MAESTITAKVQTTVPADIRALLDAKPGTRLVGSAMPEDTITGRCRLLKPSVDKLGPSRHFGPLAAHFSC